MLRLLFNCVMGLVVNMLHLCSSLWISVSAAYKWKSWYSMFMWMTIFNFLCFKMFVLT